MAFTIPSREEIFDAFIAHFASAQPEKNISRGSDPYRLGRVVSGVAWSILAKFLFFIKQMLPDTAQGEFLRRWGTVFDFPSLLATGSTGTLALRVTGAADVSIPADLELAHADGTLYKVTTVGASIGVGGSVDVSVAAISTGLATNKSVGELLTFTSPPLNVDAVATVVVKFTGGTDAETDDDYRVRFLAHVGDPPEGGAIHDWEEWARRISGVKSAYVWAHRRGTGTMDIAVLGPGTGPGRIPATTTLAAVSAYIETVRPGGLKDWQLLTTAPQGQDVEIAIEIDANRFKWDWDDASTGYAITAYDAGAKTITVPTAPGTVVAGVRLTVRGEEATVVTRASNVLALSFEDADDGSAVDWFSFTLSGDTIRASGDLVKPVRKAIMALFDTLGPARSSFSKTSWIDQVKLSKLYAAATDIDGVDDANITLPVANAAPLADTYGDTVYFLIPAYIKAWKA